MNGADRKRAEKRVQKKLESGAYSSTKEKEKKWAKSLEPEAIPRAIDEDTVPVRINAKTTLLVAKSKCIFHEGRWFRKKDLENGKVEN